jgi:hypothetical protein
MITEPLFPCPCCNAPVISEPGGLEICPTCGWEDDAAQSANPERDGGANELSLQQHRGQWRLRKKASHAKDLDCKLGDGICRAPSLRRVYTACRPPNHSSAKAA